MGYTPMTGGINRPFTIGKTEIPNEVIPAVGSVVGAWIDKKAQEDSNRANARNVAAQIDFQREQNASAYQRAVADMKAAGLNPALAYKQGGADSGQGAAAENKPTIQNVTSRIQTMVDAYNSLATGTATRKLINEQANKTQAETRLTMLQGNAAQPASTAGIDTGYIGDYVEARRAEAKGQRATAENVPTSIRLTNAQTAQATATAKQQARLLNTQGTLNEQEFTTEWFNENVAPYLNSTAKAIRTVLGGRK